MSRVATLERTQVDRRVAQLEALLAGVWRGQVDGAPTIRFSDVNVQIVNGTGTTGGTPNGRGNLIVGYNAHRLEGTSRSGSHFVVVGDGHAWARHGGIVAGRTNRADGEGATVFGRGNRATGSYASILGGSATTVSGVAVCHPACS